MNRNKMNDPFDNLHNYSESLSQRAQRAMRPNGAGVFENLPVNRSVIPLPVPTETGATTASHSIAGTHWSRRVR